ncbi:hypothetical protein, partial [uncultured Desulfovibrio sp.]|uniref:hypothetical protein n=1 Tax=uncultured Desulfovibrio sp. TaxID=167968 RepID=UPI00263680E2
RQWIALGQLLRLTDLRRKDFWRTRAATRTRFSPGLKNRVWERSFPEEKPQGAAQLRQGALQGPAPDGERVPSFEAMAWLNCDLIREKMRCHFWPLSGSDASFCGFQSRDYTIQQTYRKYFHNRTCRLFLFCLLTTLVGLSIRGALAAYAASVAGTVRIKQCAAAAPASLEAATPSAASPKIRIGTDPSGR